MPKDGRTKKRPSKDSGSAKEQLHELSAALSASAPSGGFTTQWPHLLSKAASAARARIRREGNAQAVRAAGGVFDVLVAGCDRVSELCRSGELTEVELTSQDAAVGVSALIDVATLRSDSNAAFCSAVAAVCALCDLGAKCQKAITEAYHQFEQVFASVVALRGSSLLTLEVAESTTALVKALSSYGGGCHILVGQKGLHVLGECVAAHSEDKQVAYDACSTLMLLGRSEVPGALKALQQLPSLQRLVVYTAATSDDAEVCAVALEALSSITRQSTEYDEKGLLAVIRALARPAGCQLLQSPAVARAADGLAQELCESESLMAKLTLGGMPAGLLDALRSSASSSKRDCGPPIDPEEMYKIREWCAMEEPLPPSVLAHPTKRISPPQVTSSERIEPRPRGELLTGRPAVEAEKPSSQLEPGQSSVRKGPQPDPHRRRVSVPSVPSDFPECGESPLPETIEESNLPADDIDIDMIDLWSDDEEDSETATDHDWSQQPVLVSGITGVAPKPHSRAASEPAKTTRGDSESDSDEIDQSIKFWPPVEHAVWVQDSTLQPLAETGNRQEAVKRKAEVNRMTRGGLGENRGKLLNTKVYERTSRLYERDIFETPVGDLPSGALRFDSHFESANLASATMVFQDEYDLRCDEDFNSGGHTQWYYFSVAGMEPQKTYKFSITNFEKSGSQYNDGMLPLLYSVKASEQRAEGWQRAGHSVCWYQSTEYRPCGKPYFILSFSIELTKYQDDLVYLAYGVPYTTRDLRHDLAEAKVMAAGLPGGNVCFERSMLCETVGGQALETVTLWDAGPGTQPCEERPVAVISSRVHPGESNSSWIMRGVIFFLCSEHPIATQLRKELQLILLPMLNPDGVVLGNYRCSMAGLDLNRQYKNPSPEVTPCVYWYKALLSTLSKTRDLAFVCDLHGHSKKFDSFMYGCKNKEHKRERIIPLLLAKRTKHFSYPKCSFSVQKSKSGTGRVVGWSQFGIQNCYTFEASFAGSSSSRMHFATCDWEELGVSLCSALGDWMSLKGEPEQVTQVLAELKKVKSTMGSKKVAATGGGTGGAEAGADSEVVGKEQVGDDEVSERSDSDEASSDGSDDDPCSGNLSIAELKGRWKCLVPSHSKRRAQQRKAKIEAQREMRLLAQKQHENAMGLGPANVYYSTPPVKGARRMDAGSATAALQKLCSGGQSERVTTRPPGRRNQDPNDPTIKLCNAQALMSSHYSFRTKGADDPLDPAYDVTRRRSLVTGRTWHLERGARARSVHDQNNSAQSMDDCGLSDAHCSGRARRHTGGHREVLDAGRTQDFGPLYRQPKSQPSPEIAGYAGPGFGSDALWHTRGIQADYNRPHSTIESHTSSAHVAGAVSKATRCFSTPPDLPSPMLGGDKKGSIISKPSRSYSPDAISTIRSYAPIANPEQRVARSISPNDRNQNTAPGDDFIRGGRAHGASAWLPGGLPVPHPAGTHTVPSMRVSFRHAMFAHSDERREGRNRLVQQGRALRTDVSHITRTDDLALRYDPSSSSIKLTTRGSPVQVTDRRQATLSAARGSRHTVLRADAPRRRSRQGVEGRHGMLRPVHSVDKF